MSEKLHGPEFAPGPRNSEIAELERQLAAERERCAGLAAALADFPFPNELTNPDTATNSLPISVRWRADRLFQWVDARRGEIAAAQQILAAVREKARREGAVEAQAEIDQLREQLKEERLTSEDEARKRDEHFAEIGRLRTALRETREALNEMLNNGGCSTVEWMPLATIKAARAVLAKYAKLAEGGNG